MAWICFPYCWPMMRELYRSQSPVMWDSDDFLTINMLFKNNRILGDLRRHDAHVTSLQCNQYPLHQERSWTAGWWNPWQPELHGGDFVDSWSSVYDHLTKKVIIRILITYNGQWWKYASQILLVYYFHVVLLCPSTVLVIMEKSWNFDHCMWELWPPLFSH